MAFTVLTHKATRGSLKVCTKDTAKEANEVASTLYEQWKILFKAGLAASGVSVMVIDSNDLEKFLQQGPPSVAVKMSYGGY